MSTRETRRVEIEIPVPETDKERSAMSRVDQYAGDHPHMKDGLPQDNPVNRALHELGRQVEAIANGTTPEIEAHRHAGFYGWGERGPASFAESDTNELFDVYYRLLGNGEVSLADAQKERAEWERKIDRFREWLDRAEELLDQDGGQR